MAKSKGAIGVDHGTKRTGFATVDAARVLVTPLHAAPGGDDGALTALRTLLEERDITHLVVGYPLNMDGTKGGRAKGVDTFIEAAAECFPDLVIVRQDERLTTKEAEERLAQAGYFGKDRKERKDAWSAAILLEDWMREGEPSA